MRQVLYVAHAVRPTEEEILAHKIALIHCLAREVSMTETIAAATRRNIDGAMASLDRLRRSFPETTFIAPWIASIMAGADDLDPTQREAGIIDACAVVERCDGIVLCGPRISDGMRREMEHGQLHVPFAVYDLTFVSAQNTTPQGSPTFTVWVETIKKRAGR